MSVWGIASDIERNESGYARLAVWAIQNGNDATFFIERAGRLRAERYEFEATGDIISDMSDARLAGILHRS